MSTIVEGDLWRYKSRKHCVYRIIHADRVTVTYQIYHGSDRRFFTSCTERWVRDYEPLPGDDVLEVTGGIF